MRYLVLDIETVRDPATWQPKDLQPSTLEATLVSRDAPLVVEDGVYRQGGSPIRGTITLPPKDEFAPPHGWRTIVIGCVLLEDAPVGFVTKRIGAIDAPKEGCDPDTWERVILERFAEVMAKQGNPDLITWNGRGHDLPVIVVRSMRFGIPAAWYYQSRDLRHRYSPEGHCDIADWLEDHGAARRMSLDGVAKMIGLPGKFGDFDGAGVAEAFAAGRHREIANYCISDAVQTAFVFLRWRLVRGDIDREAYQASARDLLAACAREERLADFCARVDTRVLLLEEPPAAAEDPAPGPGPANETEEPFRVPEAAPGAAS